MTRMQWRWWCAAALILCAQFASAAARLPFRSGFETGDFSEWNGGLDASMTVISQQAAAGQYSVQSVLTQGTPTDNYKDFLFGDHPSVNGAPVTAQAGVWLSLQAKFDTGFQFGQNSGMHKIAILNFEDENSRRRYQVILNVQVSTRQYFLEHLKWNADRSFNRSFPGFPQNVGTPLQPRFGQWDRLKVFVKPNTPGQNNGQVQLWVNGVLKANHANVQLREDTSYNPNKLILSSHQSDTTAAGIQRWDDFYLGETDPDGGVRPNPPVLNSVE